MGIKEDLLLWFIIFFDQKSRGSGFANNEIKQNLQLVKELHKPIIRNLKKKNSLLWI